MGRRLAEGPAEVAACVGEAGAGAGKRDLEAGHDDGKFDVPGGLEQSVGGCAVAPPSALDDALGAIHKLGVAGLDVDHEVPEDRSGADHDAGGEHVEDELGGGACFQARASGEDFGPGERRDGNLGELRHRRARRARQGDGEGADGPRVPKRAEDVGRSAAGGDADQCVFCLARGCISEAGRLEVVRAEFGRVFGGFAGGSERGVAAGDDGVKEIGRDGKGGRALAGIEDSETSAGSGADVEQAAAAAEAIGDGVHCRGNARKFGANGGSDGRVCVVDDHEHLERGDLVDVCRAGIEGLGGEIGEVGGLGFGLEHRHQGSASERQT